MVDHADVHHGTMGYKTGLGDLPMDEEIYSSSTALFDPPTLDTSLTFSREGYTCPDTGIEHNNELRFHLPKQNSLYLDPGSLRFKGYYWVEKSTDGREWTHLDESDRNHVSLINFCSEALIETFTVIVNGATISFISTADYGYKIWLENICAYGPEAAAQTLNTSGYYPEAADPATTFDPDALSNPSMGGNKTRSEWITTGKGIQGFNFPVHSDLLSTDRLIVDSADILIKVTRTPDEFLLLTKPRQLSAGNLPYKYRINLKSLELHWRKMAVVPSIKIDIDRALASGRKARYPIIRTQIKWGFVPKDTTEWYHPVLHSSKLPYMVVVAFVKETAKAGNLQQDPFFAEDIGLQSLVFNFNNVELPITKYSDIYDNDSSLQGDRQLLVNYGTFMDQLSAGRYNTANLIDFESWKRFRHLYAVDTSPDHCR